VRSARQIEADNVNIDIGRIMHRLGVLANAQALIQKVATETQSQLKFHLETLLNEALDSVFPNTYQTKLEFGISNGVADADIYLLKDGGRIDPMDSSGGGVVDVVAFALRLVSWSISKNDNVIVLDEPFKFLSVGLRPLAGELLRTLSKQLNLQLIYVTHDLELVNVADRVFEVSQSDGISKIKVRDQYEY
jgi:DNA repair exonuclease SbcCD ATPase subunit